MNASTASGPTPYLVVEILGGDWKQLQGRGASSMVSLFSYVLEITIR